MIKKRSVKLKLFPLTKYVGVNEADPLRFYFYPILGYYYRQRVERNCLGELSGGERVLEIGFGSGLSFLNLHDLYQEIWGIDLTAAAEEIAALFLDHGIVTNLQNGNVQELPYPDNFFDSVLLISILEHLKPEEQISAFREIHRVLKPGGQVVYGTPVERPLMVFLFQLLGTNIRVHHFSTEKDIGVAAEQVLQRVNK
ncbi:MAG: class I SAM-dependent methyltransferase, partial [Anaerolineaceae bacterium]|nr:class I SAM-dependent methyltransferase [Anaerolineaceae bacterium]